MLPKAILRYLVRSRSILENIPFLQVRQLPARMVLVHSELMAKIQSGSVWATTVVYMILTLLAPKIELLKLHRSVLTTVALWHEQTAEYGMIILILQRIIHIPFALTV